VHGICISNELVLCALAAVNNVVISLSGAQKRQVHQETLNQFYKITLAWLFTCRSAAARGKQNSTLIPLYSNERHREFILFRFVSEGTSKKNKYK